MTDPAAPSPADGPRPGDKLMRVGAWTTAAGMAITLVAIVPLVVPTVALPSWLWGLSMLTGVGLVLLLAGLLRSARARGRAVTAARPPAPRSSSPTGSPGDPAPR